MNTSKEKTKENNKPGTRKNPFRTNIFKISPEIIDISIQRWLRRFTWLQSKNPFFLHGKILIRTGDIKHEDKILSLRNIRNSS